MDHCHFGYITKIGRKKTLDRGRGDMPHRPTLGKAGFGPRNSAAPRNKAKQEKGGDKSAALIDIIIVMYIWKLRRHIRRTIASLTRTLFQTTSTKLVHLVPVVCVLRSLFLVFSCVCFPFFSSVYCSGCFTAAVVSILCGTFMASMSTTVTSSPQPVVNNYTVTYNLTTSSKFNPSMAIIIVVLMSALFFLGFFSIYVRNCTMADGEEASSGGHNPRPTAQTSSSSRPKGLDKSVVESLPVVHFKDLNLEMHDGNAGLDDGKPPEECRQDVHRECAVCLSEFESEDSLRLLPKCKHVFHLECIDVWFQSHSTCPLCRASLVPKETQQGHDAGEGEDQAESVVIVGEQGRAGDGAAFEEAPLEVVVTIDPDDSEEGARESQEDTQSAVLQIDSTRSGTTTEGKILA
jgi:hypothetical protein